MSAVSPRHAKALIHDHSHEIALLDVREHGQYGEGHPFLAAPCPFSRLEARVVQLVPRCDAPILLLDEGDGIAKCAAELLLDVGYRDVQWIEGGAPGWANAGFTLFKGVNLPSKTLGELVQHMWHVPQLNAENIARWRLEGRLFHLFDGRPASEHRKMRVPGAVSLPNCELPHRFAQAGVTESETVVIHCAGRTRSIIGAAGLRLAGIKNPIFALENGTQGWALSGRSLERDAVPSPLPRLAPADLEDSAARAERLMREEAIPTIDLPGLQRLADDTSRTLYVLDVRSAEEFAAGSLSGAIHAPGVQIAQATDEWIGVRRARVVLLDDGGLRAALSAVFLRMLGYEIYVLRNVEALIGESFVRPDSPAQPVLPALKTIAAADAVHLTGTGEATLLDLRPSREFRLAHLRGALWTIRPRIRHLEADQAMPVLLVGPSALAASVADDLKWMGYLDVQQVSGDLSDWQVEGLPLVSTPNQPSDADVIDLLFFVHDRHDGNLDAARRYLEWETGLVSLLDPAERAEFNIRPRPLF